MPSIKPKKQLKAKAVVKTSKKVIRKSVEKKSTGLSVKVYDASGKEKDTISPSKELFSVEGSQKLLAQYVRVYLANQRQGTASTKTRGEVTGSTRKIYRQKGTGRARHGSIKAPIFVGGGIVGGPKPRDYSLKMNKKQKRKSLFLALTLKRNEDAILVADKTLLSIEPKTKFVAEFLSNAGLQNKKVLFVLPKMEKNNFILASRNIPYVQFETATSLNPYMLLAAEKIIFIDDSLSVLEKHFLKH
ncbi:50S ribosomal protein L4 [Candidatus Roizmanbacteria bacterium]|nr:50S ribosomal protein L4 [Candidatus Roizmanbacteria bacterium]